LLERKTKQAKAHRGREKGTSRKGGSRKKLNPCGKRGDFGSGSTRRLTAPSKRGGEGMKREKLLSKTAKNQRKVGSGTGMGGRLPGKKEVTIRWWGLLRLTEKKEGARRKLFKNKLGKREFWLLISVKKKKKKKSEVR